MSNRVLWRIEQIDTYMHIRWRWSPRMICDLTELSYGVPASEPHHWRGGRPNRIALFLYRALHR